MQRNGCLDKQTHCMCRVYINFRKPLHTFHRGKKYLLIFYKIKLNIFYKFPKRKKLPCPLQGSNIKLIMKSNSELILIWSIELDTFIILKLKCLHKIDALYIMIKPLKIHVCTLRG